MKNLVIFRNPLDPEDQLIFEDCDDVCAILAQQFDVFPDKARIYHNEVANTHDVTPIFGDESSIAKLQSLEGNIFVVVFTKDPITIVAIVAIAIAAIAIGLVFIFRPHTQGQNEGSPNNELSDRQNKARPNERIPDIFGTVRSTPDLIVLPYKMFVSNQEFEHCYMCIGRGAYTIIDCKDDTTPVDDIDGEYAAVYPPFNSPNSPVPAPQNEYGIAPIAPRKILTIERNNAVNGQVLRAPNSGSFETNNNIAFTSGGTVICNDPGIDLTQYFTASTVGDDQFLDIFTNDDGLNADDPAGVQASVGLAGHYKILSVTSSEIVLSSVATVNANWTAIASFLGLQSTFYHTFLISSSGSRWVGPIICDMGNMTGLLANFVVPQGLFYIDNKGRQGALTVTVKLGVQAIDETFSPIGDEVYGTVNLTGSALSKNITGSTLEMGLPSQGPCQVRALLLTDNPTDTRNTYSNTIQWRDLYATAPGQFPYAAATVGNELVAYAKATGVVSGPDPGSSNVLPGSVLAGLNSAQISMLQSGPLANWYWASKWENFVLPDDMPSDAVITRIVPVIAASGHTSVALAGMYGGDNSLTPYTITPGTPLTTTSGVLEGMYSIPGGSLGTDITDVTCCARLFATTSAIFNDALVISSVRMAVFYTSASDGRSAALEVPFGDYGNVTTVYGITAQTQDALTVKERKLNLLVTRNLPTWINRTHSGPPEFSTVLYPTNNAADIACAMSFDPFIGRRPLSQLDVAGIYGVADSAYLLNSGEHVDGEIALYFDTFLMTEFCATFDDSGVSFEESLAAVAQAINCIAYRSASLISLFFEKLTSNSKLLFNHRNMLPDSESRSVTFGPLNDNDGVNYNYIEPAAPNLPDVDTTVTLFYPTDQSSVNPKKIDSKGVRNVIQATINGYRMYFKLLLATTQTTFDATQDANQVILSNRVLVADETRTGTQRGEVRGTAALVVTTSQVVTMVGGHTYTAFIQHYDATVEAIAITAGPTAKSFTLSAAPALPLVFDPDLWATTKYLIVDDADMGPGKRPIAFLITDKQVQDNLTFKLAAINYTDDYYQRDQDVANGILIVPIAGYGPQGYIGEGLVKQDGTGYVPPIPRQSFDITAYNGSSLWNANNPSTPVVTPPVASASPTPIEVNGATVTGATESNFNNTSPSAPAGSRNIAWLKGGSSDLQLISASIGQVTGALPGIVPAFPSDITKFFRGDGTYAAPLISSGVAPFEVDVLTQAGIAYIARSYSGPQLIQSVINTTNVNNSQAQLLTHNVAVGDLIVVAWYQSTLAGQGCSDSLGNTYTQVAARSGAFGITGVCMFASLATHAGVCTVTASGARPIVNMMVLTYSGVSSAALDGVGNFWFGTGTASPQSLGAVTTTGADLIVSVIWNDGTSTAFTSPAGMTTRIASFVSSGASAADMVKPAGTYTESWGYAASPTTSSVYSLIVAFPALQPSGDLFQFLDGATGIKRAAVNALGQYVNAKTTGAPTNTPDAGAQAYDPATSQLWFYNGSAWQSPTFINPMTTMGDLIVGGAAGALTRLGAGTLNYILTSNGPAAAPSWQANAGGGGGGSVPVAISQGPDFPPGSPGTLDDEFTDATWNTNAKWTWFNQIGSTVSQINSWLKLADLTPTGGTSVSPYISAITQPMPSGVWEVTAKITYISNATNNNTCGGLCIIDASTGHSSVFFRGSGNGGGTPNVGLLRPGSAWVTTPAMAWNAALYMRIHGDGTTLTYSYSWDGVNWVVLTTEPYTTWHATPTKVGLAVYADGSPSVPQLGCDWFRRTV